MSRNREVELDLIIRAQAGDRAARDALVRRHMGFIVTVSRRWRGRGLDEDDLRQTAVIGFLLALDKYDATREGNLLSYARHWMASQLDHACVQTGQAVKVPRGIQTELRRMERGEREVDEELRLRGTAHVMSLDAPVGDEGGSWHEVVPRAGVEGDPAVDRATVEALLRKLAPKERRIVEIYFGLDGTDGADDITLGEVGRRVGCSGEYVRRVLVDVLGRMRAYR